MNRSTTSSETLECEVPESDVSNHRVPVVIIKNGEQSIVNGQYEYLGPAEKLETTHGPNYGGSGYSIFGSGFGDGSRILLHLLVEPMCLMTHGCRTSTNASLLGLTGLAMYLYKSTKKHLKANFEFIKRHEFCKANVGPAYVAKRFIWMIVRNSLLMY